MCLRGILALLLLLSCLQMVSSNNFRGSRRLLKKAQGRGDSELTEMKGKFSNKDKTQQCTWLARGEHHFSMTVRCKPERGEEFACKYSGRPVLCSEFSTNPQGFWKQIARSLKKQMKKLCADKRAVLRAGMCKRAPPAAHFVLEEAPTEVPEETPSAGPPESCAERVDHSQLAREKCGDSWASLCVFLFTIIQSRDC
ncbi:hypothetical protein DNTS_032484 [Danionella cerebrum]|uniref:Fibroblast growth factor-binding protein 1 n=1 Tax=Danionella cerebrum TaxID=2873325 RepID=A0A553QZ02_9TELE|nr:hypothetical protein DNTS_032484 [Danionella translucida]